MPNIRGKRFCDICGKPATSYSRHLKERLIGEDETDFSPVGEYISRCDEHPIEIEVTTLANEKISLEEALEIKRMRDEEKAQKLR